MFIKRVLLTSVLGMVMTIVGAVAVTPTALDKKTVSSKAYVDTEVETKQIKIPAAGQPNVDAGETVITYTANGNGEIGERALYSDASVYNATTDADKLITASALNDTFTNLPTTGTTKLECANPGTCNLWTIVDQTAYGDFLPTGYTRLEYIQSTGPQYIQTPYRVDALNTSDNGEFDYSLDIQFTDVSDRVVLGYSANSGMYVGTLVDGGSKYNLVPGDYTLLDRHTLNVHTTIDVGSSSQVVSNAVRVVVGGQVVGNGTLVRSDITGGGNLKTTVGTHPSKAKIYSLTQHQRGTLVFNGIPAKRNSDNAVGMYNTVSGTFFTNAATSGDDFTAGPAI